MSQYGGIGLAGVRRWAATPLATIAWLMGSMARRNRRGDGPEDPAGITSQDRAVLQMLEARLKAKGQNDGGDTPSGRGP